MAGTFEVNFVNIAKFCKTFENFIIYSNNTTLKNIISKLHVSKLSESVKIQGAIKNIHEYN